MQSIGSNDNSENDDFRKVLYVLLAKELVGTGARRRGMTFAGAFCENGPYQYDDDIPDNLAACADYADSVLALAFIVPVVLRLFNLIEVL